MRVWAAIPDVPLYLTAIGAIVAFVLAARAKGEQFLIWLLQTIFGNKGGLRLVKARGKGYWRAQKDNNQAELVSRWYGTSIVSNLTVRMLTVHMKRPSMDGSLNYEGASVDDRPWNTVRIEPGTTVEFQASFRLPLEHLREGKDFKCRLVFTDSFNNRHYAKVVFAPQSRG